MMDIRVKNIHSESLRVAGLVIPPQRIATIPHHHYQNWRKNSWNAGIALACLEIVPDNSPVAADNGDLTRMTAGVAAIMQRASESVEADVRELTQNRKPTVAALAQETGLDVDAKARNAAWDNYIAEKQATDTGTIP